MVWDARRIFVVGIALIFGLSVDMVPGLYRDVPGLIQPLFASSLSVSTILVVLLNPLFRIGVIRRQLLELTPGVDGSRKIFEFMETQGGVGGARREVIMRATAVLNEFIESAAVLDLVKEKVRAEVRFDEFNLDVDIRYDGELMELPNLRPTEDALIADEKAVASLFGFLIRQYADRVKAERRPMAVAGSKCISIIKSAFRSCRSGQHTYGVHALVEHTDFDDAAFRPTPAGR